MSRGRRAGTVWGGRGAIVAAVALTLAACAGATSPVAPRMDFWLAGAQVSIAGNVVNGMTMTPGQMAGGSTFFQATMMGPNGPTPGLQVQVQYQLPHGPGMMAGQPPITLYDDGTHGDPFASDGVYCFEDLDGRYGFHGPHAFVGQYHYEFFGIHPGGEHTNHMEVAVTIVSP